MKYSELDKDDKQFLNGKISQYMDAYIRQHKVWTPDQMHSSFLELIEDEISNISYVPHFKDGIKIWNSELALKWLTTEEGKKESFDRFKRKFDKDKFIADRKSPLVERVRFGYRQKKNKFYDLNFGLKDGYNHIETNELKSLKFIPWSVEHVNKILEENYKCTILDCLNQLSTSYLEKQFFDHWIKNYYSADKPCIIPEVCALRRQFYYYTFKGSIYSTIQELPAEDQDSNDDFISVNFRYDFLVANFNRQKIAFIELDGFEYHKTREQQTIDSIKRNNASSLGIALHTFTSKRINEDIKTVFKELEEYLK